MTALRVHDIRRTVGSWLAQAGVSLHLIGDVLSVLRPEDAPARHRHYFKHETLHELAWTAPVTGISEQLGVPDVALAKLCR